MKCDHDVRDYDWKECTKCGKIVRVNYWHSIALFIFMIGLSFLICEPFADWSIRILNLNDYNPRNITNLLFRFIPIGFIYYLGSKLFPIFDEKEKE